jgi:hypothetical protein
MRSIILLMISLVFAGCQLADLRPETVVMTTMAGKPKEFILLGAGRYEGDLTVALFREDFKVKPIAVTQKVTELESPTRLLEYKEAGGRYALRLSIARDLLGEWNSQPVSCNSHWVIVTMTVIDIQTNDTLAIVKQTGPDRECHSLTPVWPLLAKELSKMWQ